MNITDCGTSRGVEIFQSRPSPGFQSNASSTWEEMGTYRIALGPEYGITGNAVFGYDNFGLGTKGDVEWVELENLPVAAFATPEIWLGELGLSMYGLNISETEAPQSFLSRLKEEGHIPSLSFGYQAGAPYKYTKVPGSLVLGGYDRTRVSNDSLVLPSTQDVIVGLQTVTATLGNGTIVTLLDEGIQAVIETEVSELWLPPSVCDAFAEAFGLTYFEANDRYALTDEAHNSLRSISPTFSFTIGNSIYSEETINITIPYAAFDVEASYPIFATPTKYFPLRRAANDSQYALGRVFMQEIYLSVDWERDVFNISQAVFSSPPLEPDIVAIEPKETPSSESSKGLGSGVIAGIVVGCVLFLALLLALGWWCWRRKQKKKKKKKRIAEAGASITEEKKDGGEFAPEVFVQRQRADLELEGAPVGEMHAAHGAYELQDDAEGGRRKQPQIVEAESPAPLYELPATEPHR
jgi:hypothetical protein